MKEVDDKRKIFTKRSCSSHMSESSGEPLSDVDVDVNSVRSWEPMCIFRALYLRFLKLIAEKNATVVVEEEFVVLGTRFAAYRHLGWANQCAEVKEIRGTVLTIVMPFPLHVHIDDPRAQNVTFLVAHRGSSQLSLHLGKRRLPRCQRSFPSTRLSRHIRQRNHLALTIRNQQTVPDNFNIHTLHCSFVGPGRQADLIFCYAERVRDGKKFINH